MPHQLGAQVARVVGGADDARLAAVAARELGGEEEVADFGLGVVDGLALVRDGRLLFVVPLDAVLGRAVERDRGRPGDADRVGRGDGGGLCEEREEQAGEEEGAQAVGAHLEFVALEVWGMGG